MLPYIKTQFIMNKCECVGMRIVNNSGPMRKDMTEYFIGTKVQILISIH